MEYTYIVCGGCGKLLAIVADPELAENRLLVFQCPDRKTKDDEEHTRIEIDLEKA